MSEKIPPPPLLTYEARERNEICEAINRLEWMTPMLGLPTAVRLLCFMASELERRNPELFGEILKDWKPG